jgi:hypothetical protein
VDVVRALSRVLQGEQQEILMLRRLPALLVLAVPLTCAIACGGAQKKAEVPDFTEKGWSGPSNDVTEAKADPPIQSTAATDTKPDKPEATSTTTTTTTATAGTEADVASGNALPPPPKTTAKPSKAKKKSKKKKTQAHS